MNLNASFIKNSIVSIISGILFFSILLTSCGANVVPVPQGKILTEGIEIHGIDRDFVLKSGEVWKPPFYTKMEDVGDQRRIDKNIHEEYLFALKHMKAEKVRIKTPYSEKELYGVLALNKVFKGCERYSATKTYEISISKESVDQAIKGKTAVLYEKYPCKGKNYIKTWILWIDDVPF